MSSSMQVHPRSFRESLLPQLQELGFDLNHTQLMSFKKLTKSKRCEGSYRLAVHIRASYPSAASVLCQHLLPMLVRVLTCCWCCCLRPTADRTTVTQKYDIDSPFERRVERMIHGPPAHNQERIELSGRSKEHMCDDNLPHQKQIWDRNRSIGKSGWYSAWGTIPLLVFRTTVISKHRSEIPMESTYDPEFDENAVTVRCVRRELLCMNAGEKCGTSGFCPACVSSCITWILMPMLLPAFVLLFIWEAIILPLTLLVGAIVALLLIEPFAYICGCCCGMKSARGAVLLVSLLHRFTVSTGRNNSQRTVDEVVAEVVLAEHISVVKTCFLQAHASVPWMSSYQYLVRNPIWGMYEPDIPVEEIAAAWTELIKRVGGQVPQTDCSQDSWSNGHDV